MKITLIFIPTVLLLVNIANAAPDIDAAVLDYCKCGNPPSSRCMDNLARKYPDIDKSRELQDRVIRESLTKCRTNSTANEGSIQDMVGNENLDLSTLPGGTAEALTGINKVVSDTQDCSTESFEVTIPDGWKCRKLNKNANDVTLHTNGNRLNVTVGKNQGMTSCNVIPVCVSEDYSISDQFDSKVFINPMVGTYEYAGAYKQDESFKLTITSNTRPTKKQLEQVKMILDSFKKR